MMMIFMVCNLLTMASIFFENDIPEEISGLLEQTELVEDENGEMVYARKETPKDDEVEGVKWVGIR